MMKYFEEQIAMIEASIKSLDENVFQKLIDQSITAIKGGNKIIVTGLGKNVPICDKFVGTMVSLGLPAYFMNTNSAVHGDIGVVKKNDIVIVLTKSGETSESVYLTDFLEKKQANIWLLSFCKDSILSRRISNHILLELKHEGDMWNIMPNNSTTVNLIVLQALAMNIAEKMKLTVDDFKANHPGGHIGEILRED